MWPFKDKTIIHKSFPIGIYELNVSVNNLKDLVEFSDSEYAVIPRTFVDGKNYNAPPITFLNRQWSMQLGIVDKNVYKIAPYLLIRDKNEANVIAMQTLQYCNQKLGEPSEQKTGLFIWDTTDGNVVFQTTEINEGFSINLFITSSEVRNFKIFP